jgi:hypothetical protein
MNLADFCSELDLQLGLSTPEERLSLAAKLLGKAYKVKPADVAIFSFDAEREELRFSWPVKLKTSGSIPLNANNSLAARTLREKRGYVDNRFAKTTHGAIFEAFSGDSPIQKIISVPMLGNDDAKGVVQVSRKGAELSKAGADFGPGEVKALLKMAAVIGRHI